jgi:hypothetical protein
VDARGLTEAALALVTTLVAALVVTALMVATLLVVTLVSALIAIAVTLALVTLALVALALVALVLVALALVALVLVLIPLAVATLVFVLIPLAVVTLTLVLLALGVVGAIRLLGLAVVVGVACGTRRRGRGGARGGLLGSTRSTLLGSAWLGSAWLGSARLGSARLWSARLGSARLWSARLGSARLGSTLLGSTLLGSTSRGAVRGTASSGAGPTKLGNELVAEGLDRLLKGRGVAGVPSGTLRSGNSLVASETEVQDVMLAMTAVACHGFTKAYGCKSNGGFTSGVGTVGVAPNSVDELFTADDGDNTEGLDARVLELVGGVVAENNVGNPSRVEVLDACVVSLDIRLERCLGLARTVIPASSGSVVGTVTVDVHIGELAAVAAHGVNNSKVVLVVTTHDWKVLANVIV